MLEDSLGFSSSGVGASVQEEILAAAPESQQNVNELQQQQDCPTEHSEQAASKKKQNETRGKKIILKKDMIHRLIRDVREMIHTQPLANHGIFYKHDDTDLLKGYALIFGPVESPYSCGCYFFEFDFPTDYPLSPPVVTFRTTIDWIRFHPNLYENGKTCLSILNTWDGEPWTPSQTIRTILLSLFLLFDEYPFFHEPEQNRHNPQHMALAIRFNQVVQCANLKTAIMRVLTRHPAFAKFIELFEEQMITHFQKSEKLIFSKLSLLCEQHSSPSYANCDFYTNAFIPLNYNFIFSEIQKHLPTFVNSYASKECPPVENETP